VKGRSKLNRIATNGLKNKDADLGYLPFPRKPAGLWTQCASTPAVSNSCLRSICPVDSLLVFRRSTSKPIDMSHFRVRRFVQFSMLLLGPRLHSAETNG